MIILSYGCVGTIADSKKSLTDSTIARKNAIVFKGIGAATPTAHNRVRASFFPATGGSGNYSYLVYVNGNFAYPVASLSSSSAIVDSKNMLSVDIKGLQTNTSYSFSVRCFDIGDNEYDLNTLAITTKTLPQMVPIFDGVLAVENLPGVAGLTELLVKWNKAQPAVIDTSGFGINTQNISGYNVYAGESDLSLTLAGVVNDANATSFTLTNLVSGKNYYVRVRAKNSEATPVEDENVTTLFKRTLVNQPIQFSGVAGVSIPKTIEGFSKINVSWLAGSGSFDRYKVWAFNTNPGTIDPTTTVPDVSLVVTDLSAVNATISVASPNTTYYIMVMACNGDSCAASAGSTVVKSIKTSPPVAPFNGITTTAAVDLHTLKLNWSKPDTTLGIYNKIKIFKTDSSGNFNEALDEITEDPGLTGFLLNSSTETSVNITDIPTDTEFCFIALAYEDYYLNLDFPFGRSSTLRVRACATLKYTTPNFQGINGTCTAATTTGFTVSWNLPNPVGIFDYYELYYKEGNNGFSFADAIAGDPAYRKITPLIKTSTSYTFNLTLPPALQLSADTYYQVGIKTIYNDGGTYHRDSNNAYTLNCKTTAATVDHKGWQEIFAIGPKINGLTANTKAMADISDAIPEKIKDWGELVDGKSELSNLQYPKEEYSGTLKVSSSNEGIVKLIWNDFELSGGMGSIFDYNTNHTTKIVYKVYRKAHASKYDTTYDVKAKVADNDWGLPINADDIEPRFFTMPDGSPKSFGQYIDYSLNHEMAADPTKKTTGTIYYYKVEAFLNGTKINFSSNHADMVVRVVLPPANMAFAHRWMLNKRICEEMGKKLEVDREKNYTCPFNGLTSKYDAGQGFNVYDMKGDLLINRYKTTCNFSRGGSPKQCADVSLTDTANTKYFEGNATTPAKNRIAGDCIGFINGAAGGISGKVKAAPGAVFYERSARTCYVNTSTTLDGFGKGTTWMKLIDLDTTDAVLKSGSKILPPTLSSSGQGWGEHIYGNDAYMPQLATGNQNNQYRVCQSNTVAVNGIKHRLRLMRRKESVAAFAMSEFLSPSTVNAIQIGTLYSAGTTRRDCVSFSLVAGMNPPTGSATGANTLDMTKWNYPAAFTGSGKESNFVVTGSGGTTSSELCVSAFGLQDFAGNGKEVTSDKVWCNGAGAGDFCSTGIKNKSSLGYPQSPLSLSPADAFIPEIDPQSKEVSKNGNGRYLSFGAPTVPEVMGSNYLLAGATHLLNYSNPGLIGYSYFSPAMGMMLSCSSTSCLIDGVSGAYDDNTLATTLTSSPLASITSFNPNGALPTTQFQRSASNTTVTSMPFLTSGMPSEGARNGRYYLSFSQTSATNNYFVDLNARCTTLIEDYADQANQYND